MPAGILILCVEGSLEEQIGLAIRLQGLHETRETIIVHTTDEFLARLEGESPAIMLVHAGVTGEIPIRKLVLEIRKKLERVPLLVLGSGDTTELAGCLEDGADDYLRIPFELIELMVRINALLRRAAMPPSQSGE